MGSVGIRSGKLLSTHAAEVNIADSQHSKDKEKDRQARESYYRIKGRSYSNDGDYHSADDHRRGRKY